MEIRDYQIKCLRKYCDRFEHWSDEEIRNWFQHFVVKQEIQINSMLKKTKQIFNEIDPYGEENWEE